MKKRIFVISGFLLLATTGSLAMSLGRHRGAAIIGRPLDVSVPASLDAQDDISNICVDADVFFADSKVDRSRVRVTTEKIGSATQDVLIRVRSTAVIDEPVVMIYLRAGCQQKSERHYVLLADLVSEADPPLVGQSVNAAAVRQPFTVGATPALGSAVAGASNAISGSAAASLPVPARATGSANSAAVTVRAKSGRNTNRREVSAPDTPPVAGRDVADLGQSSLGKTSSVSQSKPVLPPAEPQVKRTKNIVLAGKAKARLKLEPLDLTIDRDPVLKSSPELLTSPVASDQERSLAAALWRALSAQPQDILKDAEKIHALEVSVRNLQAQTKKDQQTLNEITGQLQQAQAAKYTNLLVYALALLLLAAIIALLYLWRQRTALHIARENELPWWRKHKAAEKGWSDSAQESGSSGELKEHRLQVKNPGNVGMDKGSALDLDLDLNIGADESGFTVVKRIPGHSESDSMSPLSSRDRSDFGMSMAHLSRAVKAEELFDVQQQADFFVSLGQHDQAIEVLRSHIADNVQTSALVYLDLVNLYHQLNRQAEYEALREDFNQRFNAKIPSFELYSDSSPGLESYQAALSRIEALWPSPKVLDIIEESIFRKTDANTEAFDLGAYRELLLLYAVAKEIFSPESNRSNNLLKFDLPHSVQDDVDAKTTKFVVTSIQPLSANVAQDPQQKTAVMDFLPELPKASPRLGLDVDLSDIFGDDEGQKPPAETDSQFFEQFASSPAADEMTTDILPANAQKPSSANDNLLDFESFDSATDKSGNRPEGKQSSKS